MIVLKYNFNTVFINIYNNASMCQKHFELFYFLLGGQIFSPSSVIRPALLFFWNEKFTLFTLISAEDWIDSINYLIKISIFLVFIIFWTRHFETQFSLLTLQAGDFDQVDRERGANRNQSRGIQLIHAKRLTHHPNTRYTLLVMDSWQNILSGDEDFGKNPCLLLAIGVSLFETMFITYFNDFIWKYKNLF